MKTRFVITGITCPAQHEPSWARLIERGRIIAAIYHVEGRPASEAREAVAAESRQVSYIAIRLEVTHADIDRIVESVYGANSETDPLP